jgi:hypothetical protein
MTGGSINNNVAQGTASMTNRQHLGGGGGVMVYEGTFNMNGGSITSNEANGDGFQSFVFEGFGGGVSVNYLKGGRFKKTTGSNITGNTADNDSSQVFILIDAEDMSTDMHDYTYVSRNADVEADDVITIENGPFTPDFDNHTFWETWNTWVH